MLTLFRKIRQQLLRENKFSRYLTYAIGEILLVVIGILIALQINNWNEERKQHREEQKLIAAVIREIESNIKMLGESMTVDTTCIGRSQTILKKAYTHEHIELQTAEVPGLFCYTGNKMDNSILSEILGTNSRALISDQAYLDQLRILKVNYDRLQKTTSYIDAYWNGQVVDFFIRSGVGHYMQGDGREKIPSEKIEVDKSFISLLSIMNGFQNSLLLSRKDLDEALKETLILLNQKG